MSSDTAQTIHLKDYQPSAYLIDHVSLDVKLDPNKTHVFTRIDFRTNPNVSAPHGPLVLDGENINLNSIAITGVPLERDQYRVSKDKLIITHIPRDHFTLEMETTCDPQNNTALSGLYRSGGNYCTQCEAEGFRRITFFLDRPDILARYRVRIEAEKATNAVLLSNGNKVLEGDIEGTDRHFAIWEDPFPKPSYLFALVAGNLAKVSDHFITMSGRDVTLEIFVEDGKEDRCAWAMESLKRSMKWDEEVFGREYDLDIFMIVAVSDFNMGAMENKGLNIFNDKYILARPDTATDADYANIEAIIAHEYFHNWSGNRITCRDWFQLCLKEGLTVFRDQEFSSDVRSRPVKRISDVKLLRSHQFPEDAGPLAHPVRPQSYVEINNFYTATIYEKGAEVVRMIKTIIGRQAFRKAMDIYFHKHDGEAATIEDFVACMAQASGKDFSQFMQWYNEAGTPHVIAQGEYDAAAKKYTLTLSQVTKPTPGQPVKNPFVIPLAFGLVGPDGNDIKATCGELERSDLVMLTTSDQTLSFEHINEPPVLSINREFSAPIILQTNNSQENLLFLMAHDSDPFNRFESAQQVASSIILEREKNPDVVPDGIEAYAKALDKVLNDETLEAAFVAQMLTLPSQGETASKIAKNVNPQNIFDAHHFVASQMGQSLKSTLLRVLQRPLEAAYSPDAQSAGLRSLKQAALQLIGANDKAMGAELAFKQFTHARHMTDEFNALSALSMLDVPERNEAFEQFYQKHSDDHLLVDKWFGLHAQVPFPETLGQIRELMDHPAFSLKKPNTVRALIGGFAMNNPVCFNEEDGSGYELFADVIIALDKLNPQVAARLSGAFRSWRMLEPVRSQLAQQALQRIKDSPDLSKDTFEMTERSLA